MSDSELSDYKRVHRVFAWTVMYLAEQSEVIKALRRHFSDVCSGGDVCIHKLIDLLEQTEPVDMDKIRDSFESLGELKVYWETCWEYLEDVLKSWLDMGTINPDPMWAD